MRWSTRSISTGRRLIWCEWKFEHEKRTPHEIHTTENHTNLSCILCHQEHEGPVCRGNGQHPVNQRSRLSVRRVAIAAQSVPQPRLASLHRRGQRCQKYWLFAVTLEGNGNAYEVGKIEATKPIVVGNTGTLDTMYLESVVGGIPIVNPVISWPSTE